MAQNGPTLGVDFGTSNSAAAVLRDGKPHLITMAPGQTTLPSTFFFDYDTRQTLIGAPANQALLDGIEGRFMRALKRVLGTSLMHESRQILNQRVTFVEIIARFLRQIKTKAETETGLTFDHVLSGRPVVFHGKDDPREAQAEADLRDCYLAAGFKSVDFMCEPEAAAIASGASAQTHETGLIVDIGGGTSDFSLFRSTETGVEILANHGVRFGGTDFDRAISIDRVMPLLGKGTRLRKQIGPGLLPIPNAIFNDLATWENIPFLYTAKTRRTVDEMLRLSDAPETLSLLAAVLRDELGHDLAFAVEHGKIDANSAVKDPRIHLSPVKPGLSVPLPAETLALILAPYADTLRTGAQDTLALAGQDPSQIDKVIYVGGSSLISMVPDTMKSLLPEASHTFTDVFTAVTDGLARASAQK